MCRNHVDDLHGRAFNDGKDHGLGEVDAQERVYRSCGEGLVMHVLEGHDAVVIAYGQTSSGKTHSTFGTKEAPGLVPRLCKV